MAQNVKKVASKNLKKPKVAENSKSCQNSKKLPKISKVAEQLVAKPIHKGYFAVVVVVVVVVLLFSVLSACLVMWRSHSL